MPTVAPPRRAAAAMGVAVAAAACVDAGAHAPPANALPTAVRVVTFNTGTTEGMGADEGNGGYTKALEAHSDAHYGDGLAWMPAVQAAAAFFAALQADVVGFQESFDAADCAGIPAEADAGFVCADADAKGRHVAATVLGGGYQVVCHPGKRDKCVGVRKAFATVLGCAGDYCGSGGVGVVAPGCGKGARVARFDLALAAGGALTLLHVHGSSGMSADDKACRKAQFEAGFAALAAADPSAPVIVLGDFNTDPVRFAAIDPSAAALVAGAAGRGLAFVTATGWEAPGTYGGGVASIDHVLSDRLGGACWHAGVDAGHPPVLATAYFDHVPAVCDLEPRP